MNANIIRYGRKEDLPSKLKLQAGNLSLVYESGFVRYIRAGGFEVLRMINHAVRDHNWGTAPLRIFDEEIDKRENSFAIRYRAEAKRGDIHFLWNCSIDGTSDSSLIFSIEGEAVSAFRRNRIGFTVLHPVKECVGRAVTITHSSGSSEQSRFPELISPRQPFFDIKAMEWPIGDRGKARLEFSGDIFETEDQRNWIDDSYKTYCTPLSLPFPVQLEKGDLVRQTVRLQVTGLSALPAPEAVSTLTFSIGEQAAPLPKIGIGQSAEVEILSEREFNLLQAVPFDHYQVDLKLYESDWLPRWDRAKEEAGQLTLPLEISLFFDDIARELPAFKTVIQKDKPAVSLLNIFDRRAHATQAETVDVVLPVLRPLLPDTRIGAGTNAFFTELNRDRTPAEKLDFVVYSVNPQVHAFDNDSLVEALNALPYTVLTAKDFANNKPVHISPVTFKMRWNPNATGESAVLHGQLPEDVDVRQMSLFGAAWTLGALGSLTACGATALTFFETAGMKGIIQSEKPPSPGQFPAPAQSVYPMYFIFKFLLENKNRKFFPLIASDSLRFTGLAFGVKDSGPDQVLLANLSDTTTEIFLPNLFQKSRGFILDSDTALELMISPDKFDTLGNEAMAGKVKLPSFGIGFIGCEQRDA